VSLPIEPVEEDPLDAFTYIGPAPTHDVTPMPVTPDSGLRPPASPQAFDSAPDVTTSPREPQQRHSSKVRERSSPGTPSTFVSPKVEPPDRPVDGVAETQDDISLGEVTSGGRGREGELGDADVLRLLWRVVDQRADVRIVLELEGVAPFVLRVQDGVLVDFEGPVAVGAVEAFRREGRFAAGTASEREALELLERRIDAGLLARFEVDRRMRRAREELLHDAIASVGGRFEMRPAGSAAPAPGPLLAATLSEVLVEGARRRLTPTRVRRLLGTGPLAVRMVPRAADYLGRIGLEPEIVALLERHDGASLDRLLRSVPAEEGLAGAVYALVAAGIARVAAAGSETGDEPDPAGSVRAAVEAAASLARDGHYFAILGVAPTAGAREIRQAYARRRRELRGLRLAPHGLDGLAPDLSLAVDALDEAWEVLRDTPLRDAYRAALGL